MSSHLFSCNYYNMNKWGLVESWSKLPPVQIPSVKTPSSPKQPVINSQMVIKTLLFDLRVIEEITLVNLAVFSYQYNQTALFHQSGCVYRLQHLLQNSH